MIPVIQQEIADYKMIKQVPEYQYVDTLMHLISESVYSAQTEGVNFEQKL